MIKLTNSKIGGGHLLTNAFTLIELLAVIIILAIIALIAVPIILDVVEDARISAGKSEAQMILGGINNYCATEDVKYQMDNSYTRLCTTGLDVDQVKEMVNLGNADIKSVNYDGTKLTELVIESNNHTFTLCPSGQFAMDDEECDGEIALVGDPIIEKAKELVYSNDTCKTDGTTYQYMDGCYIKGNPDNNYIWYSGFLWRIMGINADGTVRLIIDENVTAIPWGELNTAENWDGSYAKDWLNNYFYSRLKGNNIIKEETWCSETTTSNSSARTTCTNNLSTETAKVGLLTLDEYNLAGGISSYLNIGQYQRTMTPFSDFNLWNIGNLGYVNYNSVIVSYSLRAVININSNTIITGGNGTLGATWSNEAGPYILNEDKSVEITGKLNEKATSGEYVLFVGRKYCVVDKDDSGNTKLILDGYYEENEDIFIMENGSNNEFSITTGIGQKLNGDVLKWLTNNNDTEKAKLVSNYTWYQNEFGYGQSYTISLNEVTPTKSIQATVGLIRVGEMLSGQSSSILTNGYNDLSSSSNAFNYWTITPQSNEENFENWFVYFNGSTLSSPMNFYGLRPVIVIKSDVEIISGTGTFSNPYVI